MCLKKTLILGRRAVVYLLLSLLLAVAVGLGGLYLRGQRLLSVQSASMVPVFKPGDALVIDKVLASQLRVGDIVSYRSASDGAVIISHRLQAIDSRTGLLTTAGDRLGQSDPPFLSSRVIGRASAVAPRLGRVMDWIRTPLGLTLLLYLPAAVVIISEIRRLVVSQNTPFYRHTSKQC